LNLSTDLPVIIEIVDAEAKIQAFVSNLEGMIRGGLITLEEVKVIHYRHAAAGD
jgi:PII-like signaling protein